MYKFCPKCGGKLNASKSLPVCTKCGFRFYQNPAPTSGALIINPDNKILLVKRKYAPKRGFWDVPGGFVEPKESAEESMKREMKEELGITVTDFSYLISYSSSYFYQGITLPTLCSIFVVRINNQKIKVGDDVSGFAWFEAEKIPLSRLAFGFIKRAISNLLR